MFDSILFPVDFSAECRTTARYVRDLPEFTGGRITLLHVIPWRSPSYAAADIYLDANGSDELRGTRKAQFAALARFNDELFDGDCELRVECRAIGKAIVECAAHTGSDLIMMSSRPTSHVSERSTMAHVFREAWCPVWTAPHCGRLRPSIDCHFGPLALCRGLRLNTCRCLRFQRPLA